MICSLAGFKFEIFDSEIADINTSLELPFDKMNRVSNHPKYFDNGLWSEKISFSALFYFKKSNHFEQLKNKAKEKKPVLMILGTGEVYTVLITSVKMKQEIFIREGNAIKQTIGIELAVYYE